MLDHAFKQQVLAREVVQQPALAHAGFGRDRIQRQVRRANAIGDREGGVEDTFAGIAAGLAGHGVGFLTGERGF